MVTSELFVYVDESGNTYADLLNTEQPFYTMVALLSDSDVQMMVHTVDSLKQQYGIENSELHGSSLFRLRSSGIYENVLRLIEDSSIIPMVVVIDKFFIIASKIVDTFFDPHDNPEVPLPLYWNRSSRLAMVELIGGSLNQEAVNSFLDGVLNGNTESLAATARILKPRIAAVFRNHLLRNIVAKVLSYVETHHSTAFDIFRILKPGVAAGYASPNFIAFSDLLLFMSRQLKESPIDRVYLYHDEQKQFQELFQSTYAVLTKSAEAEVDFGDDSKVVLPLSPFDIFSFVDSSSSIGVQLADCLGYAINRRLTRPMNVKLDQASVQIFEATRRILSRDLNTIQLLCFEKFGLDFTRWLLQSEAK